MVDWENLELAYRRARKGKRARKPVAAFEFDRERNLVELQEELCQKSYLPGPYQSFIIHEPKRRLISAAPFRDRVVHHALCNVIEPIFERRFIFDSYANRVGKGTHRALDRCTYFARRYHFLSSRHMLRATVSVASHAGATCKARTRRHSRPTLPATVLVASHADATHNVRQR